MGRTGVRGFADHRLHHLQGDQPGRRDRSRGQRLAGHRHQLHRNRPGQRDHVLLQGVRGQRRRSGPFVGGVGHAAAHRAADPSDSADPADSADPSPTPPASSVTPPTAPAFAGPTGLTATAGDTQVRLSWTAPASDGGSPVTSYKVYLATTPGARQSTTIGTAKGADATVTHLANGTTYYFMVTAVNTAGHESPLLYRGVSRAGQAGHTGEGQPGLAYGTAAAHRLACGCRGHGCRRGFHADHAR